MSSIEVKPSGSEGGPQKSLMQVQLADDEILRTIGLNNTHKKIVCTEANTPEDLEEQILKTMMKGLNKDQMQAIENRCFLWRLFEVNPETGEDWEVDRLLKPFNLMKKNPPPKFLFKDPQSSYKISDQDDPASLRSGPQYCVELWGGFATLNHRTDASCRLLGTLAQMYNGQSKNCRRFSEAEKKAISNTTAPGSSPGSRLAEVVQQFWHLQDNEAALFMTHADELLAKLSLPLESLRKEQTLARTEIERRMAVLEKELKQHRAQLDKRKTAYYKACQMGDLQWESLTSAQMDPKYTPKEIQELQVKLDKIDAEIAQTDVLYKEEVQSFRAYQTQFERETKLCLIELQSLDEHRLSILKKRLVDHVKRLSTFTNLRSDLARMALDSVTKFSTADDIQSFLQEVRTGRTPDEKYQEEDPLTSSPDSSPLSISTDDDDVLAAQSSSPASSSSGANLPATAAASAANQRHKRLSMAVFGIKASSSSKLIREEDGTVDSPPLPESTPSLPPAMPAVGSRGMFALPGIGGPPRASPPVRPPLPPSLPTSEQPAAVSPPARPPPPVRPLVEPAPLAVLRPTPPIRPPLPRSGSIGDGPPPPSIPPPTVPPPVLPPSIAAATPSPPIVQRPPIVTSDPAIRGARPMGAAPPRGRGGAGIGLAPGASPPPVVQPPSSPTPPSSDAEALASPSSPRGNLFGARGGFRGSPTRGARGAPPGVGVGGPPLGAPGGPGPAGPFRGAPPARGGRGFRGGPAGLNPGLPAVESGERHMVIAPYESSDGINAPQFAIVFVQDKSDPAQFAVAYEGKKTVIPVECLGRCAEVIHEQVASADDELSVAVGDVVGVQQEFEGWVLACNQRGESGLCPMPYLDIYTS